MKRYASQIVTCMTSISDVVYINFYSTIYLALKERKGEGRERKKGEIHDK